MDLQLTSLVADQTRRFVVPGLRVNGHAKEVALVVRWTGASDEYQRAIANKAFRKVETGSDEWARGVIKLLAQHIVVDWEDVPGELKYTPARGEQVLSTFLRDKRLDRLYAFLAFVSNGDAFERDLVDAVDLGNA